MLSGSRVCTFWPCTTFALRIESVNCEATRQEGLYRQASLEVGYCSSTNVARLDLARFGGSPENLMNGGTEFKFAPSSSLSSQAADAHSTCCLNRSDLRRPYIERFTSFSLFILPLACPWLQGRVIAATTASLSCGGFMAKASSSAIPDALARPVHSSTRLRACSSLVCSLSLSWTLAIHAA